MKTFFNGPLWNLYKRELAFYFNAPTAYVVMVVFLLIAGYLFAIPLFLVNQSTLAGFLDTAPLLLTFLAPAVTMRLFAEEFKSGTAELLFALPAREWEIIAAKLAAALTIFALTLAFTLVYPAILLMLGDLDKGALACGYLGLFLTGLLLCSAGLFASALTKSQVTAFITGFLAAFVFFMAGKLTPYVPAPLAPVTDFIGFAAHLENMARGVLDLRDLLYYFSVSAFFLFLTRLKLQTMKAD